MTYVDPDTIQVITTGDIVTASWLQTVAADLNYFNDPPRVKAYRSSNVAIATASDTALLWNAEEWDTDSMHSTSSNTERLTATTAGRYVILGTIFFAASATATVGRRVELWKNGTSGVLLDSDLEPTPTASAFVRLKIHAEVELSATEYVQANVYQDSGGNLNVLGATPGTSEWSWISMRWVGTA